MTNDEYHGDLFFSGGTCAGRRKACGNTSATHTEPETQAGYPAEIKGMVHIPDHDTSIAAAHRVKEVKLKLHGEILEAFRWNDPMTDEELEQLIDFANYGPSTIRKRRSELYQMGKLVWTGERRTNSRGSKMKVWAIA